MDIGTLTGHIELEDRLTEAMTRTAEQFMNNLKAMEAAGNETAGALAGMFEGIGIAVGALVAVGTAIGGLGMRGSTFNDLEDSITKFSGSVENTTKIMAAFEEGSLGVVDKMTMMKDASKLLSTGALKNADDFETLGATAHALAGRGFGETEEVLNKLTNALETGRTKSLDLMGVHVDLKKAEDQYAASIGTTRENLDKAHKLYADQIAIMDAYRTVQAGAGEQERSFGEQITYVWNQFKNFWNDLSQAVARSPELKEALNAIGTAWSSLFSGDKKSLLDMFLNGLEMLGAAILSLGSTMIEVALLITQAWEGIKTIVLGAITLIVGGFDLLIRGIDNMMQQASKVHIGGVFLVTPAEAASMHDYRTNIDGMTDSLKNQTAEAANGAAAGAAYQQGMVKARDALDSAAHSLAQHHDATVASTAATEDHTAALGPNIGKLSEQEKAIEALLEKWRGGGKEFDTFTAAFGRLSDAEKGNYDIQQQLLPLLGKYIDEGKKLTEQELAEYHAAINSRDARVALDEEYLASINLTQEYIQNQKDLGRSEQEIARDLGVNVKALNTYESSLKKVNDEQKKYLDVVNRVESVNADYHDTLNEVNGDVQEAIKWYLRAGASQKDLAIYFGQTEAQIHAVGQAMRDEDLYADVTSGAQDYHKVLDELDGEVVSGIEYYLKAGVSQEKLAKFYGVTAEQIHAVSEELKAEQEAMKTEQAQAAESAKLWDQYYKTVAANSHNTMNSKIQDIWQAAEQEDIALAQTNKWSEDAQQAIYARAEQQIQNFKDKAQSMLGTLASAFTQFGSKIGGSFGQTLGGVGNVFQSLDTFNQVNKRFSTPGNQVTMGNLGVAFGQGNATATERVGAGVQAGMQVLGGIQSFQQGMDQRGKGARAMAGAQAGAQIGAVAGPYGALIGAGVGALIGALKSDPMWAQAQDYVASGFGVKISEQLGRAIQATEEEWKVGTQAATTMHLADIIKEAGGVTPANLDQLTARMRDTFSFIETHQIAVTQGTQIINDSWAEMAKAGTDSYGLLSKGLKEIIQLNDKFGTNSKAIVEYLGQQGAAGAKSFGDSLVIAGDAITAQQQDLEDLANLQDQMTTASASQQADLQKQIDATTADLQVQTGIIAATAITNQAAADAMAGGLIAQFSAMVDAGTSFKDALAAIAPGMDALKTQMDAAGLTGGAVFQTLTQECALYADQVAGPALSSVDSLTQGMVALDNMGQMNSDTFAALSGQVTQTFNNLVAQGYDGNTVMLGMKDSLQRMWEEQQEFGYKTDDSTQALIDQAVAQGIVGEKYKDTNAQMLDASNKMVDVLNRIAKALGADIPDAAASGASKTQKSLDGLHAPDLTVKVTYDTSGAPAATTPAPSYAATGGLVTSTGVQYLASGGNVLPFEPKGTDTVPAMLTPGERVLSVQQNQQYEANISNDDVVDALGDLRGDIRQLPDKLALSMRDALLKSGRRVA